MAEKSKKKKSNGSAKPSQGTQGKKQSAREREKKKRGKIILFIVEIFILLLLVVQYPFLNFFVGTFFLLTCGISLFGIFLRCRKTFLHGCYEGFWSLNILRIVKREIAFSASCPADAKQRAGFQIRHIKAFIKYKALIHRILCLNHGRIVLTHPQKPGLREYCFCG